MKLDLELRPGANRFVSESGALAYLDTILADFNQPVVITGEKSFAAFTKAYPGELNLPVYHYDGSASDENGHELAQEIGHADAVVGIGAGRLIDTAKVAAEALGAELISIPTLASNCAPFTPLAAIYHPQGHTFSYVEYFKKSAYIALVDYNLLLSTPHDFFVAGIGDTLAKWYEMDGITRDKVDQLKAFGQLSRAAAKTIQKILFKDAEQALADLDAGRDTPAFEAVADTIIGLAGEVGGFGGIDGRAAGAHATHNGLSYLPETHAILHGSKVAYGILVQLAETGDDSEIRNLIPFYEKIGLPLNLEDLHVTDQVDEKIKQVAEFAAKPDETFILVDPTLTPAKVADAMTKVEQVTSEPAA
ncbi:iron-containing alcohol dehydrogenase family protein [Lacticaseibacillus paracasei]|nr:iron-containing alcohol dehydrogenase family protein [Lacticaseibacillus paracasei]